MTIPLSMHVGGSERASEVQEKAGGVELTPASSAPVVPSDAAHDSSASASDAQVFAAPTLRPPAGAAPVARHAAPGVAPSLPFEGALERGQGFTSVIRHLSLRGWLRWIHSNRCDAALRVRTREGGSGNIWCRAGRVVDAEWGTMPAEAALQEMLRLASGAVTIDFDPVRRPRRITRPMHELLYAGEEAPESYDDLARAGAALTSPPSVTAREEPFRNSLLPPGADAPTSQLNARRARPEAHHISRGEVLAGVLLLGALIAIAFAFGRLRGSNEGEQLMAQAPDRAQRTTSLLPPPAASKAQAGPTAPPAAARELPVIPFVTIDLEPANAEVWLDQALVGLGRVELAPMPDGAMHELRFLADGYETRSLYFLGTPPAGRVILERTSDHSPRARAAERTQPESPVNEPLAAAPARDDAGEDDHALARSATRRRSAAPAPAPAPRARERAPVEPPPTAAKAAAAKPSPQIQLIEAHTPRVQVVD